MSARSGLWRRWARAARGLARELRGTPPDGGVADVGRAVFVAEGFDDDPVASTYAHAAGATVVQVPIERCRGLWFAGFPCTRGGDHPYVRTMTAYAAGAASTYEASPLRSYFERWQPATAAAALGLAHAAFRDMVAFRRAPAAAAMAPWWPATDLPSFVRLFHVSTRRDNARAGAPLPASAGSHLFGPVTAEKGALEFERCVRAYESVREHGFERNAERLDGDVRGQALVRDDGSYTVFILSGQHRVAAASASGLRTVPVRFHDGAAVGPRIVHRSDAAHWPAVRAGTFSVVAALAVFDRLFDGVQPWARGSA